MTLIVEDGSGVTGANTFVSLQEAAAFFAERGGLVPSLEVSGTDIAFGEGGVVSSATADKFAGVEAQTIARIEGAAEAANNGFAFVQSLGDGALNVRWLTTADEAAGPGVTITLYERAGWWASTSARLEAALVNAARYLGKRYEFAGDQVAEYQPLPFPRRWILVDAGSPYYVPGYAVAEDEIPVAVKWAQLWLALADLEEPLEAPVDPRDYLQSKTVGASGISKTFGGRVTRRRFPHADGEVVGLLAPLRGDVGPFRTIEVT